MKFIRNILISLLLVFVLCAANLSADWKLNPYTNQYDYYAINVGGVQLANTAGDILYNNGTNWVVLHKGDNGEVLTLAAGLPSWVAGGGGGDAFTVKVDAAATAGYFGVAYNDGIFRFTQNHFTIADGGDFVTLSLADHDTARAALGLAIGTDVQAYDADLTIYAGITPSADVQSLLATANEAAMRTFLDLEAGTDFNAYDADLTTWAGITPSANVQSFASAANYGAMRTALGVAIGSDVQAYDADLTTYAGITPSVDVQSLLGCADDSAIAAQLEAAIEAAIDSLDNLANIRIGAIADVTFFGSADSAETPEVNITGFRAGDAQRTLEIGVGEDAADTASFDGVSNYLFDGTIKPTAIDCGGVITAASYIAIEDSNELRFYDNGNYVGFEAGALAGDQIWVLPTADGNNGDVMQTNGAGTLSWVANAGGGGSMATDTLWDAQGDLAYGNADDVGLALSFNYEGDFLRLNATVPYWDTPGISDTNPVVVDGAEVADNEYALFTASGLDSLSATEVTANLNAATTALQGMSELATTAETNTGTDTARVVTPDGLAGSIYGRKTVCIILMEDDTVVTSGDGLLTWTVPEDLNGMNLVGVGISVVTVDDGADDIDVDIYNVTDTADMLSTAWQIDGGDDDSTDHGAQPGAINGATDDVATADKLRFDVTTYAGDNAAGLQIRMVFETP